MAWQPANAVEERMLDALRRSDVTSYFRTVAMAPLYLPAVRAEVGPDADRRAQRLFTAEVDGVQSVLTFTSPEAAQGVLGADTAVVVGYPELVEKWPDPTWLLALEPGTPIGALIPLGAVVQGALGDTPRGANFSPANETERGLQVALTDDDPDLLMDVLVTATVWLPTTRPAMGPVALNDPDFPWRRVDGAIAVFTSAELLAATIQPPTATLEVPFVDAVVAWPSGEPLGVNPGSAIEVLVAAERVSSFLDWTATLSDRYGASSSGGRGEPAGDN